MTAPADRLSAIWPEIESVATANGAVRVGEDDEIMLISSSGTLVRTGVSDISVMGRNTQGVRLIRVESGQRLVGLARIESIEEDDE